MEAVAQMPSGSAALLWGILTFSLLVVVHEAGHFLAARLLKVKVHEFMVGLPGPALRVRSRRSGVTYGVTAFPLGGYVRIAGMEPGEEDDLLAAALAYIVERGGGDASGLAIHLGASSDRTATILATLADWGAIEAQKGSDGYRPVLDAPAGLEPDELLGRARSVTYRGRKAWQRVVILAAGVAFNLVAAFLIFTVTLSAWGYDVPSLTIDSVVKGAPASKAGIRAGDRIMSFDGKRLETWEDLISAIARKDPGDDVTVAVRRGTRTLTFEVTLADTGERALLGVGSGLEKRHFTVPQAAGESLTWIGMVFVAIAGFFNPATFASSVENARSVVGISYEVARAAEAGPIQYAWMVAFLSLSLGAINILPLPPLDGGKVLVEIIERLRRRPLRRELSYALSAFGAALLFSLIFYLMYADVMRYVVRG